MQRWSLWSMTEVKQVTRVWSIFALRRLWRGMKNSTSSWCWRNDPLWTECPGVVVRRRQSRVSFPLGEWFNDTVTCLHLLVYLCYCRKHSFSTKILISSGMKKPKLSPYGRINWNAVSGLQLYVISFSLLLFIYCCNAFIKMVVIYSRVWVKWL